MSAGAAPLDNQVEIVTPENIAFKYRAAGPFRRFLALVVDLAIRSFVVGVLVFAGLFLIAFSGVFLGDISAVVIGTILVVWFVGDWVYGGLFETFMNGQTPGKWLCGLRVLTVDGQPINGMQAFLRNLARHVDCAPYFTLEMFDRTFRDALDMPGPPAPFMPMCFIGLVTMLLSPRFQRLGDLMCGTMVVVDERGWLGGLGRLDDARTSGLASYLPSKLEVGSSLARALASYVDRRQNFEPSRREEIAGPLARPLLAKFGLPPDTSYDLLLCALYYRVFISDKQDENAPSPFARVAANAPPGGAFPGAPGERRPMTLAEHQAARQEAARRQGGAPPAAPPPPNVTASSFRPPNFTPPSSG